MAYLSIDTETGGIGLDKSLLTLGMILTDDNLEIIDKIHVSLKPNNGVYSCSAESFTIHNIDLVKHDEVAITYNEFKQDLYLLLKKWSNDGKNKLIPVGKNINFDLAQIWDKLISKSSWEHFVSHRLLDITSVWHFLVLIGKVPREHSSSLNGLIEYYKLENLGLHDAEADAIMTLNVLKKMAEEMKLKPPKERRNAFSSPEGQDKSMWGC